MTASSERLVRSGFLRPHSMPFPVVVRERFERSGVHETVIGVVVNKIGAEELHKAIIPAGGRAL